MMQNSLIIFENSLSSCTKENAPKLIEDLVYNLVSKYLDDNKYFKIRSNELLFEFLKILKKLDLYNNLNATMVIKATIKAQNKQEEYKLYQYINEMTLLENKIEQQKNIIKNNISKNFYELRNDIEKSEFKDEISHSIDEAFLFEVDTLGILKEIAESAFIMTLEKAEDVELTSSEISRKLIYNTISEVDFEKERILKSSEAILTVAFELANEYQSYTKELCIGAVKGIQEGVALGMEKFKTSFKFCTLEEDLKLKEKELIDIEDDFISLLRSELKKYDNPVREVLTHLIDYELDTLFAKLKRLVSESREQLFLNLNELKKNPKIDDFNKLAQSKINAFKKEIGDLEKVTSQKYRDFNTAEAKKIGVSLWEKAKKFISKTREE